jgi:prepilin signal peptidase PulO-like enzyme (type II secretory pathway)
MKKKILVIVIILICMISYSKEIKPAPDKQVHFAAGVMITCATDIIADELKLPSYTAFLVVSAIAVGKESFDKNFSWEDISYCYLGFSLGFSIRWLDSLQYKKGW